jgi:TrmH family RNA methyltransferase
MPLSHIETVASLNNAVVKTFRSLARHRHRDGEPLLEGEHLVAEALRARVRVTTAALASRVLARGGNQQSQVRALADRLVAQGARVVAVGENVMAAMSPVQTPSGIVAIAEYTPPALDQVLDSERPLIVLLAGVQDPGNLGAVVRTAEAAGATGLIACAPSADPYGWKALRGGMGSTFRLPVPERVPFPDALVAVRRRQIPIVAAVPRHGISMYDFDFTKPVVVVLGAEGPGLGEDLLEQVDHRVTIPMKRPVESLNVAVSAALILYEASRQRSRTRAAAANDFPAAAEP